MLQNYLLIAFRSIKRSPGIYLVGQIGLAVGLTIALLISYYVADQFSYDNWLSEPETLYRVDTTESYPGRNPLHIARAPGPVKSLLQAEFQEIGDVTRAHEGETGILHGQQKYKEPILAVDPNFLSLLGVPLVSGAPDEALKSPYAVALSERLAHKYFGRTDIIGEKITLTRHQSVDYTVNAVFKDLPENTHLKFDLLIPVEGYFRGKEVSQILDFWGGAYFHTYIRTQSGMDVTNIEANLPAFVDRYFPDNLAKLLGTEPHEFFGFSLVPVRAVHFHGAPLGGMKPHGDLRTVWTLIIVGFLIVMVSSFNFSILATAQATLRTKEVALRKTLGAHRRQIMRQFLGEAFLQAFVAGLLAATLAELMVPLIEANFGNIFGETPSTSGTMVLWLLGVVSVTALIAGLYPAILLSGLRPATIFNPIGKNILKADNVRLAMVVGQVAVTSCLVTISSTMIMQQRFLETRDLGFKPDRLLVLRMPEAENQRQETAGFLVQIRNSRGINHAAASSAVPSDPSEENLAIKLQGSEKPLQLGFHSVGRNFFNAYGVSPLAGRLSHAHFLREEPTSQEDASRATSIVLNRSAVAALGFSSPSDAISRSIYSPQGKAYDIVAVIDDMRFRSLKLAVRPEVFLLTETPGSVITVNFTPGDRQLAIDSIGIAWKRLFPGYPVRYETMPTLLDEQYKADQRNTSLLFTFSITALVLSSIGLAATFSFSIARQQRNMAIRRIFGARTSHLIRLIARKFTVPLVVANALSWPVSFLFISDWLRGFETRIDLSVTPFLLSAALSAVLAAGLLIFHLRQVSAARPARLLRSQ